ncbi:RteC domain-containing protein [Chitinophaga eiseniae]|uniref:RteC protein n=1 Tax=Chitinophaga eiseniae TaxID=634771 RepID=A0A847SGW1_9BACT|nr:RteC domain-containing protein [Chitinophaga eiseniae]NLR78037.1 hypothetical protein [Chitinophaga eiseniae]
METIIVKRIEVLLEEMNQSIDSMAEKESESRVRDAAAVIAKLLGYIKKLDEIILSGSISVHEEIHIFKNLRPLFDGRLVQFQKMLEFEQASMHLDIISRKDLIQRMTRSIEQYFQDNLELISYIELGHSYLDSLYFSNSGGIGPILMDDLYLFCDKRVNTAMSCKLAIVKGCSWFYSYLHTVNEEDEQYFKSMDNRGKKLKWVFSKNDFVEYVYLIYSSGAFGNASIRDVADVLAEASGIKMPNPYRIFQAIRIRRNRTQFTDRATGNLIKLMDETDENPK